MARAEKQRPKRDNVIVLAPFINEKHFNKWMVDVAIYHETALAHENDRELIKLMDELFASYEWRGAYDNVNTPEAAYGMFLDSIEQGLYK